MRVCVCVCLFVNICACICECEGLCLCMCTREYVHVCLIIRRNKLRAVGFEFDGLFAMAQRPKTPSPLAPPPCPFMKPSSAISPAPFPLCLPLSLFPSPVKTARKSEILGVWDFNSQRVEGVGVGNEQASVDDEVSSLLLLPLPAQPFLLRDARCTSVQGQERNEFVLTHSNWMVKEGSGKEEMMQTFCSPERKHEHSTRVERQEKVHDESDEEDLGYGGVEEHEIEAGVEIKAGHAVCSTCAGM